MKQGKNTLRFNKNRAIVGFVQIFFFDDTSYHIKSLDPARTGLSEI